MEIIQLSKLQALNKEIALLERKIKQSQTGMSCNPEIMAELQEKYEALLLKAAEQELQITKFVYNNIEDSFTRQIIYLRCVKGYSWGAVANHLGGRNTSNSVRAHYSRYVAKIESRS